MSRPPPTQDAELHARVSRLQRRIRWLMASNAVLVAAAIVAVTAAATAPLSKRLDVERINIVESDGSVRMVISNAAQFPLPRLGGKEFPRAVSPAGLVFYDTRGDEVGGLALTDVAAGRVSALAFDYPNYDAVGLYTRTDAGNGRAAAGLQINSHPPAGLDVLAAAKVVHRRIAIENEAEDARIILSDPQGRERIRLRVDKDGTPRMEMLDERGRVTFSAPDQAH